eukprot:CAMPEP_0115514022 /NCGR_PEP_ID=MMETSP0271-20121206/75406_1 /TAXON_ID=71861 /ORGANISM="Scrippsiella trochoidea, Strain CCMP3099" /LENGTH=166 /DNA_ID=CAMNT_0002944389 /DNA_START=45 /DNA_END=542 /DNA_ORIENTATION=+
MEVVDPEQLCLDSRWEIETAQISLPLPFQSFIANGNLVTVSFKQQVLHVENLVRQHEQQQLSIMNQVGGLLPMLARGGLRVDVDTVFWVLDIGRDQLVHDTYRALQNASPQDLRKPLKVKFRGEEGVDEGGVAKEYFRLLSQQLFSPAYGMFKCDEESRYLWFDPG